MDRWRENFAGLAQVAMQGGTYAAKSILRKVKGQSELPPFTTSTKDHLR